MIQSWQPLGDQAVLVYLADEAAAVRFAAAVREAKPAWLVDVVLAYTSVAVFYDLDQTTCAAAAETLQRLDAAAPSEAIAPGTLHEIPCCYDFPLDLPRVAQHTGLTPDAIIRLHTSVEYTVYAIGFCPGFPYLGYLPPELCGVPRLETPRLRVEPGSVGLTGRQTGIYPLPRPGGWNLIGRTPLELVNVADGYFPLRPGDRVRFTAIDRDLFDRLRGERVRDRRANRG
jgi:inhibitor of KinA